MKAIGGVFRLSPQEWIIALSNRDVMKSHSQIKLFPDPALLRNRFENDALLSEMQIEMNAIAVSIDAILL